MFVLFHKFYGVGIWGFSCILENVNYSIKKLMWQPEEPKDFFEMMKSTVCLGGDQECFLNYCPFWLKFGLNLHFIDLSVCLKFQGQEFNNVVAIQCLRVPLASSLRFKQNMKSCRKFIFRNSMSKTGRKYAQVYFHGVWPPRI